VAVGKKEYKLRKNTNFEPEDMHRGPRRCYDTAWVTARNCGEGDSFPSGLPRDYTRKATRLMESQIRQQNKAVSSAGLRPKSDSSGMAQKQFYSILQTRPLVREGATK
jgi:hypothetical protein